MGKRNKRNADNAEMAKRSAEEAELPDTNCCLPHCETPGRPLVCGHRLCTHDALSLMRYLYALCKFTIQCPMCRKDDVLTNWDVLGLVSELPFKCIVVPCACKTKGCQKFCSVFVRPCKAHNNYTCELCRDNDKNGPQLRTSYKDYGEDAEEEAAEETRPPVDYSQPGWGIPDHLFDFLVTPFLRNGHEAYARRLSEARRLGRPIPRPIS